MSVLRVSLSKRSFIARYASAAVSYTTLSGCSMLYTPGKTRKIA